MHLGPESMPCGRSKRKVQDDEKKKKIYKKNLSSSNYKILMKHNLANGTKLAETLCEMSLSRLCNPIMWTAYANHDENHFPDLRHRTGQNVWGKKSSNRTTALSNLALCATGPGREVCRWDTARQCHARATKKKSDKDELKVHKSFGAPFFHRSTGDRHNEVNPRPRWHMKYCWYN